MNEKVMYILDKLLFRNYVAFYLRLVLDLSRTSWG
jgi:hypothetical protein